MASNFCFQNISMSDNPETSFGQRNDEDKLETSPRASGQLPGNSSQEPYLISPGAINKAIIYEYNRDVAHNVNPNCPNNSIEIVNHSALRRLCVQRPTLRTVEDADSTHYESILTVP